MCRSVRTGASDHQQAPTRPSRASFADRAHGLRGTMGALVALLAGCASVESTPIQAYVWEMGHRCEHTNSAWQLDRVDAQGRYWIKGANTTSAQDFEACMQEQIKLRPYAE